MSLEPVVVDLVRRKRTEDVAQPSVAARGQEELRRATSPVVDAETPYSRADDLSIPPVGDLGIDEKFFSEGDLAAHDEDDDEWGQGRSKHAPHVVERRARFVRYVKAAIATAALVCIAATVRVAVLGPPGHTSPARSVAPVAEPARVPPGAALGEVAMKMVEPVAVTSAEVSPAVAAQPAAWRPRPSDDLTPPGPNPGSSSRGPEARREKQPAEAARPQAARDWKAAARAALERGHVEGGLRAASAAVTAHPDDADAWLLLGAAYEEKGEPEQAQHCYASCASDAKRGAIAECRALVQRGGHGGPSVDSRGPGD